MLKILRSLFFILKTGSVKSKKSKCAPRLALTPMWWRSQETSMMLKPRSKRSSMILIWHLHYNKRAIASLLLIPSISGVYSANGLLLLRLWPNAQAGKISAGQAVNFSVPTGNFGDILAGWYAKKLGLPIKKLLCASNENNVLTEFFASGIYDRKRPFHVTTSPSMDILVSSNLERLLFYTLDQDATKTAQLMDQLSTRGVYMLDAELVTKLQN